MAILDRLVKLDRRWIFLLMFLCVLVPILWGRTFPEITTPLVDRVFDAVENLPDGSKVLMALDYEPAAEGELGPMSTAFTRHCIEKKHKMYFLTTWPLGTQMIAAVIDREIKDGAPHLVYGEDYVNLGYKPGYEGVIKVIVTDLKQLYTTDHFGTSTSDIPMCKDIQSVQDMNIILNMSAGYAGTREWVQYASTPFPETITLASGCTGVQAPLFYPYLPKQLIGLLGAIKGAAEYEVALAAKYPKWGRPEYTEALRRMAPQLWGHLLVLALIIAGNVLYFVERRRRRGHRP